MAPLSRILALSAPALRTAAPRTTRAFQTSSMMRAEVVAAASIKKPVGAFRGGMFGFLLGTAAAGAGMYYYVVDEYRVSNELLTEDIYALQAAVQRIESYVRTLEEKVDAKKR
ncbi:hypothetical protein BCR34DRAFT_572467 [Clohesyomyces aquaticus]|uniref:Uncharacterized protein n=1 Tax=Clohesyomyces aquaticus TaxID=1231657 RepID=A0A1Y1Z3C4_9PLEO|nr:hypothetical protein BCR34DRAFT_572467 [Clohesyomyces aquaticus]